MKIKYVVFVILSLFLGNISGCRPSERTAEPWIPVLENTSFSYLKNSVSKAVKALKEAEKRMRNSEEKYDALFQTVMDSLLTLHFYYVPMTEVRQLVYDADRLFYLGQTQQAQQKLNKAHEVLLNMATADGPHLEESVNDVVASIDDLSVNIQESSDKVLEKFKEVGQRVNFMCLKGELVLSVKRSGADIKKSAPNVIGVGPNGHSLLTERLMPIPIRRHDEMSKDTQLSDWRYIV